MNLPLSGCRVLDLGIVTAGAGAAAILADLGADVIKIESASYTDPFRQWASANGEPTKEASPFFRATNRNKRSLVLDLKRDRGRDVFLRLAAECDVVVENFSRGVLGRLGLDFATLSAANPGIILASISSQGESGPDAAHVSFGSTLDAMSGIAWMTGYPGEGPTITGRDVNYPDQVVTLFAAGIIVTAIHAKRRGAPAVHLDLSQRDLATFLCGDAFLEDAAERKGNADPAFLLQECFMARDGKYVALSIDVTQELSVRELTGADAQDLEDALRDWIASQEAALTVEELLQIGVAAAEVTDGETFSHRSAKLWSHALIAAAGDTLVKGFPFQIRETPLTVKRLLSGFGSDGPDILKAVGGFSDAEIEAMIAEGVMKVEHGDDR